MAKIARLLLQSRPGYLILLAVALHLTLVVGMYSVGRLSTSHAAINEDGILWIVFRDSVNYLTQANSAVNILRGEGIRAWVAAPHDAHVKIYSLSLVVLGPLFGHNILSAEPVNLGGYLAILFLVFKLGKEAFDRSVGLTAAVVVGLWPSFLLHTTQILKEPLFLPAFLLIMLVLVMCLTRALSWLEGLAMGLMGGAAVVLISLTRNGFWGTLLLVLILFGAVLFVARQVRERTLLAGNLLSIALVLLTTAATFSYTTKAMFGGEEAAPSPQAMASVTGDDQASGVVQSPPPEIRAESRAKPTGFYWALRHRADAVALRAQQVRLGFVRSFGDSGSAIDMDVEFKNAADLVRYIPRAMEVGFLSPFPDLWFASGSQIGRAGRLASGAEMLATYPVQLLALFGVWRSRRRPSTWLLFGATMIGVTTLGLVMINVGTLYRMRYAFFILLIILGMNGLARILSLAGASYHSTGEVARGAAAREGEAVLP
jgi:hypothetical protein